MYNNNGSLAKAVALKYDLEQDNAPKVTATGQGEIAKKIIKIAEENQIPIRKDEDLVELLSKLEINEEIPPKMYKAIAEIFRFIYDIAKHKQNG